MAIFLTSPWSARAVNTVLAEIFISNRQSTVCAGISSSLRFVFVSVSIRARHPLECILFSPVVVDLCIKLNSEEQVTDVSAVFPTQCVHGTLVSLGTDMEPVLELYK